MSKRYIATFEPQAWQNDYAIPVDPEGPTEWDCTDMMLSRPDYFAGVDRKIEDDFDFLDRDDVLKSDQAAPEWIREWGGPFTITVSHAEEAK